MSNSTNSYLFYVKIQEPIDDSGIIFLLKQHKFSEIRKQGNALNGFRQRTYTLETEDFTIKLTYSLPPLQITVSLLSIKILLPSSKKAITILFEKMKSLQEKLQFSLIDGELKTHLLVQMAEQGLVDKYGVGLSKEQTADLEERAIVLADEKVFWENVEGVEKRGEFG